MSSQSQFPSLLLGTRNAGKVREIETILVDIPWRLRSLRDFPQVGIAAETAPTYGENAITKAQFYARETGLIALADDSGLEVEALGGAPGVFSARYAGAGASDADRRALLLSELARVVRENAADRSAGRRGTRRRSTEVTSARDDEVTSAEVDESKSGRVDEVTSAGTDEVTSAQVEGNRRARFVCVVAIAKPDGTVLTTSEGMCEGKIIFEERGSNGFGYDPLFVPDGFDQTFAELSDSIKNQISHRARALLKTREFLMSNRSSLPQTWRSLDQPTHGS